MDDIHIHGLAKLINKGIAGEVHFEGFVRGNIRGEDNGDGGYEWNTFYRAEGQFILTQRSEIVGRPPQYNLSQRDLSGRVLNTFNFEKVEGSEVQAHYPEKGTPSLTIPIKIHPDASITLAIPNNSRVLY